MLWPFNCILSLEHFLKESVIYPCGIILAYIITLSKVCILEFFSFNEICQNFLLTELEVFFSFSNFRHICLQNI